MAEGAYQAIKAGYRLIDEAGVYGNEKECGQGIAQAIEEGIVTREDLFITSKVWNTHHAKDDVKLACKRSIADLGVDYLDLYMVHFPIAIGNVPHEKKYPVFWHDENKVKLEEVAVSFQETWQAMEELVAEGLVRSIGSCNIGMTILKELETYASIPPAVLQVEMHPYLTQEDLLAHCKRSNIAVTAYSSFGGAGYVEFGESYGIKDDDIIWKEDAIVAMGQKYEKSPQQILLRWAIQRGTAIIPKSSKPERISENFQVLDFQLAEEEMEVINGFNRNRRFNDPGPKTGF